MKRYRIGCRSAWAHHRARAALLVALLVLAGCADPDGGAAALQVDAGWVREAPPGARMTAAYGTLENPGGLPVVVEGWSSPAWRDVSLHRTVTVGDVRSMEPVERLEIPARGAVSLEPGGLHLMLMGPVAEAGEGSTVPIEARREDGRSDVLEFVVTRR